MSVTYKRSEVVRFMPVWTTIRKVLEGAAAMKEAGDTYLPMPNPNDKDGYKSYLERAIFYEATGRTLEGLVGQVFYRDPELELTSLLEPLELNVDGGELTLIQQSKESVSTVLALGHAGLLTDYPNTEGGTTRAEQESGAIRPTIVLYQPERILNWRWTVEGSRRYMSMLVLEEFYDEDDDGFEVLREVQHRVFKIEEGILRVQVYRNLEVVEDYYPTKGDGTAWDRIPFAPMGSINNDPIPDKPPMEGLAQLNVGHYRNSADYEDSCHMVGQPTPWGSGLTEDWVKEVWDGEIKLGSRAFVPLPSGGSCGLIQASPNTMPKEAMDQKEKQMVSLGAKLVENKQVQRTATEVTSESVVENSILSSVAQNVTDAYLKALGFASEYANAPDDNVFSLSTNFEISTMTAQERAQLLAEWQGGGITWGEYRWNMDKSGITYEDKDTAKETIEQDHKI